MPYHVHSYIYPSIYDFDTVVLKHNWTQANVEQVKFTLNYLLENYFVGFIVNKDDEKLETKLDINHDLVSLMTNVSHHEHEIVHDTITCKGKELYLIKRR